MLRNPGFEEAEGDIPANWHPLSKPVSRSPAARTGQWALKLGNRGRVIQCFAVEKGFFYRASVWVKGRGKFSFGFYEYSQGPGSGYVSSAQLRNVPAPEEWSQLTLTYSKGPNEENIKGLCLALQATGDGAEVLVDDGALLKAPVPKRPANLLANADFDKVDAGGIPVGWKGEKRRLSVEGVPGGGRAIRCDAALFSEDYEPEPGLKDWWNWARWGEPRGSGWPGLPRPLGGAYTVFLQSPPAPVEPGRRYDVRLLLRELDVWGEFIGVRWLNSERKSLGEFEERIGYHHMYSGGSSDWMACTGRVTAPRAARFGAIVAGAKQSSGTIWVARPSLTAGLGAPYRHKPRDERGPASIHQGRPQPNLSSQEPVKLHRRAKRGIELTAGELRIGLKNGVSLVMPLEKDRLAGITRVACGKVLLRSPKAPPLAPVVQTSPVRKYIACQLLNTTRTKNGLMIRTRLLTTDGDADDLDWLIEPESRTVGGQEYAGFAYAYRFRSRRVRALRVMDRATWEVGGQSVGNRMGRQLLPIRQSSTYALAAGYRFVASESFDYQTGPAGTLLCFLDQYQTSLFMGAATRDFVIHQDTFLFPEVSEARTVLKHVLYSKHRGDADDWARVRDNIFARYRKQLDAPPEGRLEPAAMILGWAGFRGVGNARIEGKVSRPDYFRWVAKEAVPRLADLEFKRLMIVLGMTPWNWPDRDINTLGPEYAAPFKALCDAAHGRGMKVIAWYGTCQNKDQSPVWKEHPEFILWGPDGQRARTYYSPGGWPGKLAAGFYEFTLDRLRETRRRTGLDALWLDSYKSATHLMKTARHADAVRQADLLLPWQAEIERMGYLTYCEGNPTALGFPAGGGWRPPADWLRFHPEHFYKFAPYFQQNYRPENVRPFFEDTGRRAYYRLLANQCCPILDMGFFAPDSPAIELIRQANRDYNAVSDLLDVRRLLGQRGVEWSSRSGRAIFAFENFTYTVPRNWNVRDVTAGKNIRPSGNRRLHCKKYHTYRLSR